MVYCEHCEYCKIEYDYDTELCLWQWRIICRLDHTEKKEGDFCNKYKDKIWRIKMGTPPFK